MDIVLASRNQKKIKELKTMLSSQLPDINVLSLDDVGITEEIEENGKTFEENARIKASVPAKLGYISVADDSGLTVDYLDGEPGVYSARYSGEGDEANNRLLLEKLKGVPFEKRSAKFVSCVVCIFPKQNEEICVRGEVSGFITEEKAGNGGFGYDPLFFVKEYGKTFGEISPEEKNKISHRGNAMRKFCEEFSKKVKEFSLI